MDITTLIASAAVSAFGLAFMILGACVIMRQFNYLFVLGLGLLSMAIACASLFAYRLGGEPWLGPLTILGLMGSFLLIHSAMSRYVGKDELTLLEWAMVPTASLACVIFFLGYDGVAFIVCFAASSLLVGATTKLYWDHRHQVPYLLHSMAAFGLVVAGLFLLRAFVLVENGQWVIGGAPDNWVEDLTALAANLMIVVFGPLVVAMHHVRDRVALISEAITDPLTGLRNRRALLDLHGEAMFNSNMAFVMFDLDHFKRTNDVFGHQIGDDVLRRFAYVLSVQETTDVAAFRLGGEEFGIVVARGGSKRAHALASRVVVAFGAEVVRTPLGPLRSTVSGGVATGSVDAPTLKHVMALSDAALYKAKNAGRNQVVIHGAPANDPPAERKQVA